VDEDDTLYRLDGMGNVTPCSQMVGDDFSQFSAFPDSSFHL
jgi:hypothetical protein